MADYTQGISIDGRHFDIPLVSVKRNFEFLDKFAERTETGDMERELIGVYINYTLSFGIIDNEDLYDSLIDILSEPVEFHDFSVPTSKGHYSFRGYVSGLSDELEKIYYDTARFSGLTCKYTAKKPARTP